MKCRSMRISLGDCRTELKNGMVADVEKSRETLKTIEKKRKELGLSQVELAKRIGFSRGYYNMLIHGKKPVSDKLADQLQNVLQEYRKEKESGYGM